MGGFGSDFMNLFKSGAHSDLEFVPSEGGVLRAHRSVVEARLPEFMTGISSNVLPARINVPDVPASVVQLVLEWAYSNNLNNGELRWEIFRGLLDVSIKYRLETLAVWLQVTLERNLDVTSLPVLLSYLEQNRGKLPLLSKTVGNFVITQPDVFFAEELKAAAFSLSGLEIVLEYAQIDEQSNSAPSLTDFPPSYEPPTWLNETRQTYVAPPVAQASPQVFPDSEKEKLLNNLGQLSDNEQCMEEVGRVVEKYKNHSSQQSEEEEIDLNSLPYAALLELLSIVQRFTRQ